MGYIEYVTDRYLDDSADEAAYFAQCEQVYELVEGLKPSDLIDREDFESFFDDVNATIDGYVDAEEASYEVMAEAITFTEEFARKNRKTAFVTDIVREEYEEGRFKAIKDAIQNVLEREELI